MAVQWAMIGTDDCALEFAKKMEGCAKGSIKIVVSDDPYDAFSFAKRVGAPQYYSSLESVLEDAAITYVYITQIDPSNMELVMQLLECGKSVVYDRILMSTKQLDEFFQCFYNRNALLPKETAKSAAAMRMA